MMRYIVKKVDPFQLKDSHYQNTYGKIKDIVNIDGQRPITDKDFTGKFCHACPKGELVHY
jgi:hypothetical protein